MEVVKGIVDQAVSKVQEPQLSTGRIAKITPEQVEAMGDVLDRWRLNQGFNPYDDETQMLAIQSWVHILERRKIPAKYYNELYERAIESRGLALSAGREMPRMGAELLLGAWEGQHGLNQELRQREIDAGRTLTENAESVCRHCFGTGWRAVDDTPNAPVKKCDHTG